MTSKRDMNRIFRQISKSEVDKIVKDDVTKSGSLIVLRSMYGEELGMVLKFIHKNELKDYCRKHKIQIDKESEIWHHHYAVIGHYKKEELENLIQSMNFDDKPALNLLIVKVDSKTSYNIVVGDAPEMQLLFKTIREIAQADDRINDRLNQLLGVSAMSVMTDDLKEKYRQAQENPTENEVKFSDTEKLKESLENETEVSEEAMEEMEKELDKEIAEKEEERMEKFKQIPHLTPKEIVERAREKGKKNRGEN